MRRRRDADSGTSQTGTHADGPATETCRSGALVELTVYLRAERGAKVLNQIAEREPAIFHHSNAACAKRKGQRTAARANAPSADAKRHSNRRRLRPRAKPAASPALNFIVGNEHIETTASIELVRFTF